MTKAGLREQLLSMFALYDTMRVRLTVDRVQLVDGAVWVYTSGEVSGRLPLLGWMTVLTWRNEPEVARREGAILALVRVPGLGVECGHPNTRRRAMTASKTRRRLLVAFAFTGLVSLTLPATAQQPAPAPAPRRKRFPSGPSASPRPGREQPSRRYRPSRSPRRRTSCRSRR